MPEPLTITDADWCGQTIRIGTLTSGECEFVFFEGQSSRAVFRPQPGDAERLHAWLAEFLAATESQNAR